jgi:hypothetical protein
MITDGYECCRKRKLPSMPCYKRKLYHPDCSNKDLRRDTSDGHDGYWSISSEVDIWRRDHFWMLLFLSSLLLFFSSLDPGPVQMASAWAFTTLGFSQVEVDVARPPNPPNGYRMGPVGTGTYNVLRVRTGHECLILRSVFVPFLLYGLCIPRGLRLETGIM